MIEVLGVKHKQPSEIVPAGRWGVDFAPNLVTEETITEATVTVSTSAGENVTAELTEGDVVEDEGKVSVAFIGGEDGGEYTVEFQVATSEGGVYEEAFALVVRELGICPSS